MELEKLLRYTIFFHCTELKAINNNMQEHCYDALVTDSISIALKNKTISKEKQLFNYKLANFMKRSNNMTKWLRWPLTVFQRSL